MENFYKKNKSVVKKVPKVSLTEPTDTNYFKKNYKIV
jgi:hypothetical protein